MKRSAIGGLLLLLLYSALLSLTFIEPISSMYPLLIVTISATAGVLLVGSLISAIGIAFDQWWGNVVSVITQFGVLAASALLAGAAITSYLPIGYIGPLLTYIGVFVAARVMLRFGGDDVDVEPVDEIEEPEPESEWKYDIEQFD